MGLRLRARLAHVLGRWGTAQAARRSRQVSGLRILVVGVYMTERPNLAPEIVRAMASRRHQVQQRWVALGQGGHGVEAMRPVTVAALAEARPKFALVNEVLRGLRLEDFDYLLVTDDDIELPPHFVDRFIGVQHQLGFGLAQPARSAESNADHPVTWVRPGLLARRSQFVEIGPLFSVARAAFGALTPFDERFFMGWGLDLVWPRRLQRENLSLGIVDAVPMHHRFRPVASTYSAALAKSRMASGLEGVDQVPRSATRVALRSFLW